MSRVFVAVFLCAAFAGAFGPARRFAAGAKALVSVTFDAKTRSMTIRNVSRQTLYCENYHEGSSLCSVQRKRQGGWLTTHGMVCGTGLRTFALKPGEEVRAGVRERDLEIEPGELPDELMLPPERGLAFVEELKGCDCRIRVWLWLDAEGTRPVYATSPAFKAGGK